MQINLRDYQSDIISRTRELMQSGKRTVLIESPTGSGKTLLTASMLKTASQKGMSSLFLCHRRELINQSHKAFNDLNIGHGVIGAGFPFSNRPLVQIGSIQTVKNRLHLIRKPNLIVFDECHHIAAGTWKKVYQAFPDAYIIGLTATPQRLDGKGLAEFFDDMVSGKSVQWLIDNEFLSKYKIFAPSTCDISKVHTRMGDFVTSELADAIDKPTITGDAIKEYQKLANGKRAIVRGVSIKHSQHVAEQFNKEGIKAIHLDGTTPMSVRDNAMESFRRGEILVLTNVDLFSEGLDVPAVECVIDLRPTKSLILWLQFCGRALRPSHGKDHAIIIDHAGNVARHGLPCDIRTWTLEGKIKRSKEQEKQTMIRLCSYCFGANQTWRKQCQYCNNQFAIESREVDQVDGELTEIDINKIKIERKKMQGQAKTKEELLEIAKKKGYKKGWVYYVMNGRNKKKRSEW